MRKCSENEREKDVSLSAWRERERERERQRERKPRACIHQADVTASRTRLCVYYESCTNIRVSKICPDTWDTIYARRKKKNENRFLV